MLQVPQTEGKWNTIPDEYNYQWQCCCPAHHTKRVVIINAPNRGPAHFNTKEAFSVILVASVDAVIFVILMWAQMDQQIIFECRFGSQYVVFQKTGYFKNLF